MRSLETLEQRVQAKREKAKIHNMRVSQKAGSVQQRVNSQGTVFKEKQAQMEQERQG